MILCGVSTMTFAPTSSRESTLSPKNSNQKWRVGSCSYIRTQNTCGRKFENLVFVTRLHGFVGSPDLRAKGSNDFGMPGTTRFGLSCGAMILTMRVGDL